MAEVLHIVVIRELQRMYKHYRKPLDDDELIVWSRHLMKYEPSDVSSAIGLAMSRSEAFCPVVGKVLSILAEFGATADRTESPYEKLWSETHRIIMQSGAFAAVKFIDALDDKTRHVVTGYLERWLVDVAGKGWPAILSELEIRSLKRTDGVNTYYYYIILDELAYIMRELRVSGALPSATNGGH